MSKTFYITTFGCQMNEHDSETMSGLLLEMGYEKASSMEEANIVLFNTCSIRDNADQRFFGTLGQLKHKKEEEKDDFIVCVCGCMMQQKPVIDEMKKKYPWVDIIFGTHNIHELPMLINKREKEHKKQLSVYEDREGIIENLPCDRLYKHKSYVNIMYGCNNFCSYCIVPYTRGRERSRNPLDIINEVKKLVSDGVVEIMLLGQNVNSYNGVTDDGEKYDFTDLLYALNNIDGLLRIRFMTSHPKDLSDKLINAFKDCDKLCHYLHLPVQAGSSKVLTEMNRKYTRNHYLALVEKIRKVCPDIAISTDIIVGFPGEREKDFNETLTLCKEVRYDSAFTFLYSKRTGTPASVRKDQVPDEVMHERFDRLCELINTISAEKNAEYVGKVCDVLVEGPSKRNSNTYCGRTGTFKLVNFEGKDEYIGHIVKVRITSSNTFSLEGKILEG